MTVSGLSSELNKLPLIHGSADIIPNIEVWTGIVFRPPNATWDGSIYRGPDLISLDRSAVRASPQVLQIVQYGNFVGLAAADAHMAQQAASALRFEWSSVKHDKAHTGWESTDKGGAGRDGFEATYRWPTPIESAAEALAWWHPQGVTVLVNCESPSVVRADLACLLGVPRSAVHIKSSSQSRHTSALDVAADAALLARAVGRPVRLRQQQEHSGSGRPGFLELRMRAVLDEGGILRDCFTSASSFPWRRPSAARLIASFRHDSVAATNIKASDYIFGPEQLGMDGKAPLSGVSATLLPTAAHVFARESFLDEAARSMSVDPVELRLRHMDDISGAAMIREVAERAGWSMNAGAAAPDGTGRGFAYACIVDGTVDPPRKCWSAWIVDVEVDPNEGSVEITRLVVGHNLQELAEQGASAPNLESRVHEAVERLLSPPSLFDDWSDEKPKVCNALRAQSVDMVNLGGGEDRTPGYQMGAGESLALPAAAAVANAIYDATGVRLRQPPFNTPAVRKALGSGKNGSSPTRAYAWLGGIAAVAAGLIVTALPWRAAIAPAVTPELSLYSAAAIERGGLVAAAGDCIVCHTAQGGKANAGGLALETPFGRIYTTNITPDPDTGIGSWSYSAFERAMREGIHRDGRRLYPAFPYTSFAKMTDADMHALYAYLMSQPAVSQVNPETQLAFPYNQRWLMAGWNLLFHDNTVYQPDPSQSTLWNRGAYLVQGAGHCGACHTPRNSMGAEKTGAAFLAGGEAEGWEAPALNALSRAPLKWTEDDLFQYLRTGFSSRHGVAAGPMAPVVHGLASLPEADVRAIATYLASFNEPDLTNAKPQDVTSSQEPMLLYAAGERTFNGACAACHAPASGPRLFGVKPDLALNTNLHSDRPDNIIQVILQGISNPAASELGYMPAFRNSLNDDQITELVAYMRAVFAKEKPAWPNLKERVRQLRLVHPEDVASADLS